MSSRNLRDGIIVVRDGASAALEIVLDSGNLSWTENRAVNEIMDRGKLDHVRLGDEAPVNLSFSAKYVELNAAAADTLYDALNASGQAAAFTTVAGVGEDVKLLNLLFIVRNPDGASNDEYIAFDRFYHTSIQISEGDQTNEISISGNASITKPTLARS